VLEGNRQITIKADDLKQLFRNAAVQGKAPLMLIRLAGQDWVLLHETDFLELIEP
jgi:Holliday junction resolvase